MTAKEETTMHDVAQALGLRGEKRKSMQSHPLPTNTEHDPLHHLLHSANWGATPGAVLLVTGVPEEANELSRTEGTYLDTLFAHADAQAAVAQVYVGSGVADILRVVKRLPLYLRYAWALLGDHTEVHIVVFSAGVFALSAYREMPEARKRVRSLTLASPFLGADCVRSPVMRAVARLLGFPSTAQCLDSISPLVESLLAQGQPVRAHFGQADPLIHSRLAADSFHHRFPLAAVEVKARAHAPSAEELWPC
jgi:hypothetical protein